MTYPRQLQVSLKETPYYHCIARCVRRAWLWGYDQYAGKDYSHRKYWVIDRLRLLSSIFAIEVCAYAVLANHYHTVLYVYCRCCAAREFFANRIGGSFGLGVIVSELVLILPS